MEKHFLEQYKTHDKPEAKRAAERKEARTDETGIVSDRTKRIEAYLERLEKVFLNPNAKQRERLLSKRYLGSAESLRDKLYSASIIKADNFPESYFAHQKSELKNRGMGDVEFSADDRRQEIARVQEAQKKSLDAWIDHLSSDDSHYPADIKYFAMQGILRAGSFDKEQYRFGKREASTTTPYCQPDHEVLSKVLGALEAVHHKGDTSHYHKELLDLIGRNKDFGSMYAEAMRYLDTEASKDKSLEITDGVWRVFKQRSDPQELVKAFAGRRAFLCLGNIGDASGYLERGDVHVYFSNNRAGTPVWPRVAVAVKPDMGAYELRGTYNANEDIDPEIAKTDIIKSHIATVPNGEAFARKDTDMRRLTALYRKCFREDRKTKEKTYLNPVLTKEELLFLYEINGKIEGFGLDTTDQRAAEIRLERDKKVDMPIVFDCAPEEIARASREITERTKAYVGPLAEKGIFRKLASIEHIYNSSFPEGKVARYQTELGVKTKDKLKSELVPPKYYRSDLANQLLEHSDFTVLEETERADLVRFTVKDLGFDQGATTDEIYKKAEELGLELCPAEAGPRLRLSTDDPTWMLIAMKQITDLDGNPRVFGLGSGEDELWLDADDAWPGSKWLDRHRFVFLLRKKL